MTSTAGSTHRARPLAIVTGASVGIGEALAWELAVHGYDLALVARDRTRLDEVGAEIAGAHGITTTSVGLDLTDANAPEALLEALGGRTDRLDVVVNNAGFGKFGPFSTIPVDDSDAMIQLNIAALTRLTRLVIPGMLKRGRGRILNVASTAAFQPGPRMAVYYATKAYVLSFSEALFEELRGSGVTVTTLCPGPTKTEFHARADMEDSALLRKGWIMSAEKVARLGYRGMARGKRVVTPGLANRLGTILGRISPRGFAARVVYRLQAPRGRKTA